MVRRIALPFAADLSTLAALALLLTLVGILLGTAASATRFQPGCPAPGHCIPPGQTAVPVTTHGAPGTSGAAHTLHLYAAAGSSASLALLAAGLWRRGDREPAALLLEVALLQYLAGRLAPAGPLQAGIHYFGAVVQAGLLTWLLLQLRPARGHLDAPRVRRLAQPLLALAAAQVVIGGVLAAGGDDGTLRVHRAGGLLVPLLALAAAIIVLPRSGPARARTLALLGTLALTYGLGVGTASLGRPLPLLAAHSGGALVALLFIITLLHTPHPSRRRSLLQRAWAGLGARLRGLGSTLRPEVALLAAGGSAGGMVLGGHLPEPAFPFGMALVAAAAAAGRGSQRPAIARFTPVFVAAGGIALLLWQRPLWPGVAEALAAAAFGLVLGGYPSPRAGHTTLLGAAAGAAPILAGWAAAGGSASAAVVALSAIAVAWTPGHLWARALAAREEYATLGLALIPNLRRPVPTHTAILFSTLAAVLVSPTPLLIGLGGSIYAGAAALLGGLLLHRTLALQDDPARVTAGQLAGISTFYLLGLVAALSADHMVAIG